MKETFFCRHVYIPVLLASPGSNWWRRGPYVSPGSPGSCSTWGSMRSGYLVLLHASFIRLLSFIIHEGRGQGLNKLVPTVLLQTWHLIRWLKKFVFIEFWLMVPIIFFLQQLFNDIGDKYKFIVHCLIP